MKKLILMLCLLSLSSFATDTNEDEASGNSWNGYNNPYKIDANFEARFQNLPLKGDMSSVGLGWPGYYWANQKAGISQRWQSDMSKRKQFKYDALSVYQLKNMSVAQVNALSPAEKYDIYMGNYTYPTVDKVRSQTSPGSQIWAGICHGVSPAGLHHKEPQVKTVTNADGVKITFYSSDIKALAAYYYAKVSDTGITQVGKRCFMKGWFPIKGAGCSDVNPGSLHIIMANRLGITKNGFIADIDRFKEVWNHVAVKFESKVLGYGAPSAGSAAGTYKTVSVKSTVHYTGGVDPSKNPIIGTENAKWDIKTYEYTLDLNAKGEIIGGDWESKERPDFLWVKDKETFEHAYYGNIKSLL